MNTRIRKQGEPIMRRLIMWNMVTLMQHDLIDEYRLGINPIVLGSGNPLFKPSPQPRRMKLLEARPLKSGCVILRCEPEREGRTG